jgi:hypothetical protein
MPHVTFIHGMANKPPQDRLLEIWRRGLREGGLNLATRGVSSSMVYWADVLYPEPAAEDAAHESTGQEIVTSAADEDLSWREDLAGDEAAFVDRLASRLNFDAPSPEDDDFTPPVAEASIAFERIPLPWALKRRIMKTLLRDVHHYLFNLEHSPKPGTTYRVRDRLRELLVQQLVADRAAHRDGPHVLVSHSMGTLIAYDCLLRVPGCPVVDAFMTIGSPLGLDEIQDQLKPEWSRDDGFPSAKVSSGSWVNVYDRLDPVAGFDPNFANDYRQGGVRKVEDINEQNWGSWRHDIAKYLQGPKLVAALKQQLGFAP